MAIVNWYFGWGMVLAGFLSGAVLGIGYAREDFLGGYASFPRRMVRLGHIALAALGMMNVLFALSAPHVAAQFVHVVSVCFMVGGVLMPLVCFMAAWRKGLRHLFPLPVLALVAAVVLVLFGGLR